MNERILDDAFNPNDTLLQILETDEKVIWEGRPDFHWLYWFMTTGLTIICPLIFFLMIQQMQTFIILIVSVSFILAFYEYIQEQQKRYLITNQRIIFQFPENDSGETIRSFLFEEIRDSRIDHNNTISFISKKSNLNWPMKKLKLERINNFEEVEKYIQLGIRGEL